MQIGKINKALLALIRAGMFGEDISGNEDVLSVTVEEWDKVYFESVAQGVFGIAFEGASTIKNIVPRASAEKWFKSVYSMMVSNQKVLHAQTKLIELLEREKIDYAILKGTSASASYKNPSVRAMGDVDFIVRYEDIKRATKLLLDNAYMQISEEHHCHLEFSKDGVGIEMHFEPNGIPSGEAGDTLRRDLLPVIVDRAVPEKYEHTTFRMPDVFSCAMVFILHKVHHILGDGIGLRQLCDWAAFVDARVSDEIWQNELMPYLKKVGLYKFAQYMNYLSVEYLGMSRRFWIELSDKEVADELINSILTGGNFGKRNTAEKYSGILISNGSDNKTVVSRFFSHMLTYIKAKWPKSAKYPVLIPVGMIYFPIWYIVQMMLGKRPSLKQVMGDKEKRENVFNKIAIFETKDSK